MIPRAALLRVVIIIYAIAIIIIAVIVVDVHTIIIIVNSSSSHAWRSSRSLGFAAAAMSVPFIPPISRRDSSRERGENGERGREATGCQTQHPPRARRHVAWVRRHTLQGAAAACLLLFARLTKDSAAARATVVCMRG